VFENRVLKRIFEPKRGEVTGGWRKLHNEELHNLYTLPNIIRMIKSRRMRRAGHVARMSGMHVGYWWESQKEKRLLGTQKRRWMDNINTDLTRYRIGWYGLDRSGSRYGTVEGSCEQGNEPSGSIKSWEIE
jgi:hypothetical protein